MPIDYKEYPANWKTEIRPAILARANNRCEFCGIENHAVVKREKTGYRRPCKTEWDMIHAKIKYSGYTMAGSIKYHGFTKIVLTVAHLDHDKLNHHVDYTRLKALCQKCHLQYDMANHIRNRKYGRKHVENNLKLDI